MFTSHHQVLLDVCFQGGTYVVYLMDNHAAPISLIFICLMEVVAVSWFYGQYTLTVLLCANRLLAEYPLPSAVPQYTLTVAL